MSQKQIPFYIIKVLEEETDKENPLRSTQILHKVNQLAISDCYLDAGEKLIKKSDTVVENIMTINDFYHRQHGFHLIGECEGTTTGAYRTNKHYFLAMRPMEFEEVHFLHRFALGQKNLTEEDSVALAKKLENLLNTSQRKRLKYKVNFNGTRGTANERVYENLDILNECIRKKANIQFEYFKYNLKKQLVKRDRDDGYYTVSPYNIIVSSGKYYLRGYHHPESKVKSYRIDKMMDVREIDKAPKLAYIEDKDGNKKESIAGAAYMYESEERGNVKIRCEMEILDHLIERFDNISLDPDPDPDYFKATLKNASYGAAMLWIKTHCDRCEVLYPDEIRDRIKNELCNALKQYSD